MNQPIRFVYVEQFGGWWRFAYPDWVALVRRCVAGLPYDLDNEPGSVALKRRPRCIGKARDKRLGFYAVTNDVWLRRPLKWTEADWADELEEVSE
jgi:hypothetical protein